MYQEVLPNIYLINVPLPESPLKSVNTYFIKGLEGQKNLIVDSGFNEPASKAAFFEAMVSLDFSYANTDFLATHLHSDHFAIMRAIEDRRPKIYLGRYDKAHLTQRSEMNSTSDYFAFTAKLYGLPEVLVDEDAPFVRNTPTENSIERIIGVNAGDVFEVGGYSFEAVLFEGHTPGHIGLYDKEKKVLLCGDHLLGNISSNITYWKDNFDSLGSYLSSLSMLNQLDVEHLLCGHRSNDFDIKARIAELFDHHTERLSEVVDILAASKKSMTSYEVAAKMTWSVREDMWEKYSDQQKWFATGEAMAHLEYLYKRGRVEKDMVGFTARYCSTAGNK